MFKNYDKTTSYAMHECVVDGIDWQKVNYIPNKGNALTALVTYINENNPRWKHFTREQQVAVLAEVWRD